MAESLAAGRALEQDLGELETMPAFLDRALGGANAERLAFSPGDGSFSLTEHACHLRDVEREGYLVRARRILAEEGPTLAGFQGDVVARERNYRAQDACAAARDFAAARRELVSLLRSVTPAQLRRTAIFGGKAITLRALVAMMVEHDSEHRDQMRDLETAVGRG